MKTIRPTPFSGFDFRSHPVAASGRVCLLVVFFLLIPTLCHAGFIDHLARSDDVGANKVPSRGHSHVLVIPVELDTARLKRLPIERIRRFFTDDPQDLRLTFPGYWRVNSQGRYRVTATVTPPVRFAHCPFLNTGPTCTPARGDVSALLSGVSVVRRIIQSAIEDNGLSLADFDLNGPEGKPDGYIDGVILIANGGWFGVALPFGLLHESAIIERDGVRITMAAIASGPRALPMSLHEFGHLLGFADLYDEWNLTYGLALSLMGSWDYNPRSTPLLDAYSRMQIGWADVEQIEKSARRRIEPAALGGTVYKLGDGREFFLVETRAPFKVYDRAVGEPGLAVTHINLDRLPASEPGGFLRTVADCPNCRPFRPFIMNVQADGRYDLQLKTARFDPQADLFRTGDALLPGPRRLRLSRANLWFSSNDYWGWPTGVSVSEIDSDSQRPAVVATLSGPLAPKACQRLRCPAELRCQLGRCVPDPLRPGIELSQRLSLERARLAFAVPEAPRSDSALRSDELPRTDVQADSRSDVLARLCDWRIVSVILFLLWLLLVRPRIKRAYEKRLREKGRLGDDEDLKNRF
jgi:M6 family metalloprotease-like protein